eukprot:TRINITY_DN3099_c0_g2_i2.p1 TRINITY_DN3099_c0_g2~~TRINITY_DN3099_c0_g2_i2.p1  ORF type:complete len:138 (-),score=8.87 TRINITY_DN3099_c0_g2_i2:53-466(-)
MHISHLTHIIISIDATPFDKHVIERCAQNACPGALPRVLSAAAPVLSAAALVLSAAALVLSAAALVLSAASRVERWTSCTSVCLSAASRVERCCPRACRSSSPSTSAAAEQCTSRASWQLVSSPRVRVGTSALGLRF